MALAALAGLSICSPDLKSLESEQQALLHSIQQSKIESEKLREQLDQLQQSKIGGNTTLNVSNIVIDSGAETDVKVKGNTNYTAPIIVMLPEEPSDREKWEYAITLQCLGQKDFSPFEQVHNSKMLEMSTIKGTTVREIQKEIKDTEKEIDETKSELKNLESASSGLKETSYGERSKKMHLLHNIKLMKHEIDILETKLHRLHKRLKVALLFSSESAVETQKQREAEEAEEEGKHSKETGDSEESAESEEEDL